MEDLVTRLLDGQLNAAPRILTLLEKGDPRAPEVMQRIIAHLSTRQPREGGAHRIGITGPPGAGKSTLVEAITAEFRKRDRTVGVLVVDPSSPFTGGAILGDRVRMRDHFLDPGVFIRSMATRGASGGLSAIAPSAMRVLDAAGVDVIILETAGVGQTELDIMHTVDTVVVVVVPEAGDAIQTMKAGLLEIADVFVVNKSDRPGAKRMATDLEITVHLGSHDMDWWTTPVVQTEGIRNIGVPDLLEAIEKHHTTLKDTDRLQTRRAAQRRAEFHAALRERLLERLTRAEHSQALAQILQQVETGALSPPTAADQVLQRPGTAQVAPRSPPSAKSPPPTPPPHSGESPEPIPSPPTPPPPPGIARCPQPPTRHSLLPPQLRPFDIPQPRIRRPQITAPPNPCVKTRNRRVSAAESEATGTRFTQLRWPQGGLSP